MTALPLHRCPAMSNGALSSILIVSVVACTSPTNSQHFDASIVLSNDAAVASDACGDGAPGDGTAPVVMRRAVAVIVDFANAQLEDWTGPGFDTVAEVAAQLHAMEDHWAFLSRGRELMHWDIIRIQLPQPLTDTAFAGFNEFRDAAVLLAKQQLTIADYDANHDGVIDTMWLIASNNGTRPPYLVGGTSQNQGANNFGDGQDSDSVVGGATGNFNHEVGHTLGLVDIYGAHDTLQDLTLMSSSWPLPPNDFSAFERARLGWVVPQVIAQSTHGVILPEAGIPPRRDSGPGRAPRGVLPTRVPQETNLRLWLGGTVRVRRHRRLSRARAVESGRRPAADQARARRWHDGRQPGT